jgi:hypothetical protein
MDINKDKVSNFFFYLVKHTLEIMLQEISKDQAE